MTTIAYRTAVTPHSSRWLSGEFCLPKILWGVALLACLHSPAKIVGATVVPPTYSVTLSWDPSPGAAVFGYEVLYGTASGNYTNNIHLGKETTATISGLNSGVTYYFSVAAYDLYGRLGQNSAEVSFTVENPSAGLEVNADGQVNVMVKGVAGREYEIQATWDLKSWTSLGTIIMDGSGTSNFSDTDAANYSQRFYRIQEVAL